MNDIDFNALPGTESVRLISARPCDRYLLGLVFKRGYTISSSGRCDLTDVDLPLTSDAPPWDPDLPAPFFSPPRWDPDLYAFKPAADVVVQGHAYTYTPRSVIDVELQVGPIRRIVRVYGDRRMELKSGHPLFSPAEPFAKLPLRYDRAYGGVDMTALNREGDPIGEAFGKAKSDDADVVSRSTEFHYPRNPGGCGYLMTADPESLSAVRVPNLEFPFDPVLPERLAVGKSTAWVSAPLPAGFDWYHPSWFPRLAFMGFVQEHEAPLAPVPESIQGWVPGDILDLSRGRFPFFDQRFQQGASPGLSIPNLAPDAEFTLKNMFPSAPEKRLRLPGVLPRVTIDVKPSDRRETVTRMTAVVISPDEDRVVLVYAACCEVSRKYGNHELADMKWSIG